jgi:hypothetical protein
LLEVREPSSLFPAVVLQVTAGDISSDAMGRWRTAMRELSAEARLHMLARSLSGRTRNNIHLVAFYSAFALIAAVVFGTLSVHPF